MASAMHLRVSAERLCCQACVCSQQPACVLSVCEPQRLTAAGTIACCWTFFTAVLPNLRCLLLLPSPSPGASRCAKGFYALKGSRKPCQQCPAGRTTVDDVSRQRLRSDCIVDAGFGVVNSTANSTDPFNVDATDASDLPVIEW